MVDKHGNVGTYLICVDCNDSFFVCSSGVLILPWKCKMCGGQLVENKEEVDV